MRIAILPTGKMEWIALRKALKNLFPNHDFYCLPTQLEIDSNPNNFPAAPFTTCDVTLLKGKENNADKLIARAAAEAIGDRNKDAADLVLIIDDLEICNLHQANEVVNVVREASNRFLNKQNNQSMRLRTKYTSALRNKVSFHLAKPMIESWLFADLSDLKKHCAPTRSILINPFSDPEILDAIDPLYISDNGSSCTCFSGGSIEPKDGPMWLKKNITSRRQEHPKAYLSWLCFAPHEKDCSHYAESKQGATALENLNWGQLFFENNHSQFARSMVQDIADGLGASNPYPGGVVARETYPPAGTTGLLLRNI